MTIVQLKVKHEHSVLMIAVQVLMDITDVVGDRDAGVRTIPVVAGQTIPSTDYRCCSSSD
jgi:hypothetical protein